MKRRKFRTIIVSCTLLCLCIAMVVAATYSLLADNSKTNVHLEAGSLKIVLTRTNLKKTGLNSQTGLLETIENDEEKDFSSPTAENAFGIADGEKIVPSCEYQATMRVENGGNVAFDFVIAIRLNSTANNLASQLEVFIDGESKGRLSDFSNENGVVATAARTVQKSANKTFTVKIAFVDTADNNSAQAQKVDFDLLVLATQTAR